jgi:hypothetical protein
MNRDEPHRQGMKCKARRENVQGKFACLFIWPRPGERGGVSPPVTRCSLTIRSYRGADASRLAWVS